MLAASLILGILPLAVMPFGDGEGGDDDHDPQTEADPEAEPGEATVLDPVNTEPEGEVYSLSSDPGTTVFEDFEPGVDIVELDLTEVEGDIGFDTSVAGDGVSVSFSTGSETTTTLVFSDQSEVPAGDIILRVADPDTGEPYEISLGDMAGIATQLTGLDPVGPEPGPATEDPETTDPSGSEGIIDPTDPEAPDPPGPGVVVGTVVDPIDPALPGTAGPEVDPSTIIEPVAPNTPGLASQAEVAPPAAGLEQSTENQPHWLYPGDADQGDFADIADFNVGEDFLRVSLNPNAGESVAPDVSVTPSENGEDGVVIVNGDIIAVLRGAPDATLSDIHAETRGDMFF